ncbi:IS3 family transposase [Neomoorella thermoacetica]|uniref:IS3 family transposase n=1 Tax=Neomoorella thermoacetica TaxID=1525 RepID=UPI0011607769|nr:IS3 family transposase [Moorella thermoacetica]
MSIRKKYPTDFKAKVVLEILKEEKSVSQLSSEYGIHPSILNRWRNMVIEKLPSFFTDEQKNLENIKAQYEKQIQDLYAEVGRLTTELTWLKKRVASEFNRNERVSLVEWGHPELPIKKQAELLSLNRSSLYYQPVPPCPEEIAIKHRIDEIYTAFPFYGSRRITAQLRKEGFLVNRKAVQRHMREMGLIAIYPGPNLSRRNQEHHIYPYLLRNLDITRPDQVWGIDITYIRLVQGWMYLVAIIDWYSRFVVGWALDQCLATTFVLQAVEEALARARPEIMNSDQGSQFTSPEYINLLQSAGIKISMDGKGRAIDNIFTERLWRSLKYEEVYLNEYSSPREARRGIARYLEFYNYRRIHQSLEYKTPAEVYFYTKDEAKCISIL